MDQMVCIIKNNAKYQITYKLNVVIWQFSQNGDLVKKMALDQNYSDI